MPKNSNNIQVYDFFAGCGGASSGFQAAGMEIVYALDQDKDAMESYEANFPKAHLELASIQEVNVSNIHSMIKKHPGPVLFCGCAPCQPFTRLNYKTKNLVQDDRVPLLNYFANLIESCKPDLIFLENVPGLQKLKKNNQLFGNFVKQLKSVDYELTYKPIKLANYGVPQTRQRLVLVGSLYGKIELPEETHGPGTENEHYKTVRDSISFLPAIEAGETDHAYENHSAAKLSSINLKRIKVTPEGGGNRAWPDNLKLDCHKNIKGYTDTYGRMSWDKPAPGLTTKCISYSNGRFGHPIQDRAISIREAACIQTFDKKYKFKGSMISMARQIGNAVPPRFATVIGLHFINHLKKEGVIA